VLSGRLPAIMIGRPTELIALAIKQHQIAAVQREPHQNLIDMCSFWGRGANENVCFSQGK